ncbi:copine family protein 1-like isoform X1 [Lingula anatina]|uniref:Copine family protein 1-like isoform X1 n=1 Tax=Lingula anatina TaxID=7574 RepID=A0A2R2MK30_LINAN|nr:copine family protein 1-like isoform X1 [Lingula anatina]XP_023930423.1 copine family protein 1-like isoform X1 [Lingula anatina]|eukprot:XP_023930422.1 copine family protein 1-like isoform X1 [Lingula anatina]
MKRHSLVGAMDSLRDYVEDKYHINLGNIFIFATVGLLVYVFCCRSRNRRNRKRENQQRSGSGLYPDLNQETRRNSVLNYFGVDDIRLISDRFTSLEEVTEAIRKAGLESCNLIFGVDYTASNNIQGQRTFGGRCLHYMGPGAVNPYQQVISILGETIEPFDEDGIIPVFGFGDQSTRGTGVFPFRAEGYCTGFHDALQAYNQITPNVKLSGPTNFAPLIRRALEIVRQTKAYHILVIVADGQVTNEQATRHAIVEAAQYPLSIIMIGVGDGPWDMMKEFDDSIPQRRFDNFQFVDFNLAMRDARNPQAAFALAALMEIPDQFKAIKQLGLLEM